MPVFPLVGSRMMVSGLSQPRFFGGIEHRDPDAVLDAAPGIEVLQLGDHVGHGALGYPAQPHQRRVSD